jgi:hypothetical protein
MLHWLSTAQARLARRRGALRLASVARDRQARDQLSFSAQQGAFHTPSTAQP